VIILHLNEISPLYVHWVRHVISDALKKSPVAPERRVVRRVEVLPADAPRTVIPESRLYKVALLGVIEIV
jgi:hypothetical protein